MHRKQLGRFTGFGGLSCFFGRKKLTNGQKKLPKRTKKCPLVHYFSPLGQFWGGRQVEFAPIGAQSFFHALCVEPIFCQPLVKTYKNLKNLKNYKNFKNYKNHKTPFMLDRLSPCWLDEVTVLIKNQRCCDYAPPKTGFSNDRNVSISTGARQ